MDSPLPQSREGKKPIPTPRRIVAKSNENFNQKVEIEITSCKNESLKSDEHMNTNTFSRRVSNASKQIAGDIGQLVQDKKTAILSGTRESLRRIKRTISASSQDTNKTGEKPKPIHDLEEDSIHIFNNITFESPLSRSNSIYSNYVENETNNPTLFYDKLEDVSNNNDSSSDESISLPPPTHPPPPLPDESVYDAPSSVVSSNNSSSGSNLSNVKVNVKRSEQYESVFPVWNKLQDLNSTLIKETEASSTDLSSSSSWKFYDTIAAELNEQPTEAVYSNDEVDAENNLKRSDETNLNKADENIAKKIETNLKKNDEINLKMGGSSTGSSSSSGRGVLRRSVYENHEIVAKTLEGCSERSRPSQSVILQFDPLISSENKEADAPRQENSDLKLLEELLQGDLYGNMSDAHTADNWSLSDESQNEDFFNPPTPPMRVDSLPEEPKIEEKNLEKNSPKSPNSPKSRTSWFTNIEGKNDIRQHSSFLETKKVGWLRQVKEALEKTPEIVRGSKHKDNMVDRPVLGVKKFVQKRGMLYKVQSGPVEDLFGEYSGRWCILENSNLVCYSDNTCSHLKENFPAQNVLSVQILQDMKYKYKYDNDDLHCFELNVTGKSRGGHIYGTKNLCERRIWMQSIAESLTSRFKSKITTNFTRMGWAYIREGVSGNWSGAWLILSERELHYAIDGRSVKTIDLRKARCIVLQLYQDSETYPKTNDKGPNLLVDCPDMSLYLRMWTARETKVWSHIIKLEAHNNGANLDQQQLTKNDIPVIVEKCINFVYAHGSMSEGIYRRAGQGSNISELLSKFRKDAFAVQLTTNNCNEHEVATAIKRFFRDLPEPLFGTDHRQYLFEVSKHNVREEKIRMFKAALDQLPSVSYKTARKVLGHLHFIGMQSAKNLMTIENLASIWGPTLMHYEENDRSIQSGNLHRQDTEVVAQLIRLYRYIFPEDPGELEKERMMLKVLERLQSPQGGTAASKQAGDFRVWIFLYNKEGKSYNVAIGPNKTAYDVIVELSDKIKMPVHELVLEEIVLSDRLIRPIHFSEKVLDVVLKWSYWDECYRKENYLTIATLSKYWEYIIEKPLPVSGELKFADNKSRLFRLFTFQFTQSTLTCFKDKTGEAMVNAWKIEDITWYLGHESKRNPQSRWTVTFMENDLHPLRTKATPYFGYVLVWPDASARANWLSAMLKARYPNNLAPPPNFLGV